MVINGLDKLPYRMKWFQTVSVIITAMESEEKTQRTIEHTIRYFLFLVSSLIFIEFSTSNHSRFNHRLWTIAKAVSFWCLFSYCKVGCVFSIVISSEFRMWQYRDDDHREDARHFIIWDDLSHMTHVSLI